jgi:hypothetical protein
MKEKILAELKKKYAGQLTVKFMEGLAERLEPKVKEEKDIEGVISELDNLPIKITDLQAEGDRRASAEQLRAKEQAEALQKKIEELNQKKVDDPKGTGAGTDLKIQALEKQVNELLNQTKKQAATSKLREIAGTKKIMPSLLSDIEIEDESKIDEVINKLEAKQNQIRQEFIDQQIVGEPPKKGTGKPTNEQIKQSIAENKIKQEKK